MSPTQGLLQQIAQDSINFARNPSQPFMNAAWLFFSLFAIWRIIRFGVYTMAHGLDGEAALMTFGRIFAVDILLKYYSSPFPGADASWPGMISNIGVWMAGLMDSTVIDQAYSSINTALNSIPSPAFLNIPQTTQIWVFKGVLWGIQAVMMLIIGFAWPAIGVLRWFGPIFIPFALTESYSWPWVGWLRALVQFSFYLPVGVAFCCIYGTVWMHFFATSIVPMDFAALSAALGSFVIISVAMIWGLRQIPSLTSAMFSGQAGIHSFPGIGPWKG